MPYDVILSISSGVASCKCPILSSGIQLRILTFELTYTPAISVSYSSLIIFFSIKDSTWIGVFIISYCSFIGNDRLGLLNKK